MGKPTVRVVVKQQFLDGKLRWLADMELLGEAAVIADGKYQEVDEAFRLAIRETLRYAAGLEPSYIKERVEAAAQKACDSMVETRLIIPKRLPPAPTMRERLLDASGHAETRDPLIIFLYLLMRDRLPVGAVAMTAKEAVEEMSGPNMLTNLLSNGFLADYASFLAGELRGHRFSRPNPAAGQEETRYDTDDV